MGVQPLKDPEGEIRAESLAKAKILANQYASVQTDDSTDPMAESAPEGPQAYPDIGELTITVQGVEALLRKLNPSKATGPDEIPGRLLQELACQSLPQQSPTCSVYHSTLESFPPSGKLLG